MTKANLLPPFKRFCVTIGNLPSSYVDSMSYYECIMWLCKYLKETVVPTVNANAEAVNELIHWFENLDVQDEIDKKLDEMAEDGTLGELIGQYITTAILKKYNTLEDLKSAVDLENDECVNVLGKNELNDGSGSYYYIRTKTEEDIESDTLIFIQNNLVAEKINLYAGKTTKKLYGITDNACIVNINNTGIRAQIMGFNNDSELGSYANRDQVVSYKEFRTTEPNIYAIVSCTETSVSLSTTPENVEIGSIVDLYENNTYNKNNKYSGFVTSVNDNVINVSGWYATGDTSSGQIPSGMSIATIDMPTKVWVNNDNLILTSESNVKEGVIAEYGLINEKGSSAKANGIDIVNFKGNNDFAYQARSNTTDLSSPDLLSYGFFANNIGTALLVRNAIRTMNVQNSSGQTLAYLNGEGHYFNNNLGSSDIISMANNIFKMNNNGVIQSISLKPKELASGNIDSSQAVFFILTGSATMTLDSGAIGRVCIIKSRSALNNVVINGNTYGLQSGKIVVLINNGSTWEDILGVLF